ncbi:uroporphyrinogen-III synthase [Nitriliruptoraceae bacterium ZYF776]|nr:uroporphyrinogen-III synthase [Profundirhabdus halotolerans]
MSSLAGRRVLVLRTPHQARALADRLRDAGAEPVLAPTIDTLPGDLPALRAALDDLAAGRFGAVAFTSTNAVAAVAGTAGPGPLPLGGAAVWAVGTRTAEVVRCELRVPVDLRPGEATGASLAEAAPAGAGRRVLLPRGDLAADDLPTGLRARGWEPVEVVAYRTVAPAALPDAARAALAAGDVDLVAATSASSLRHLVALHDGPPLPPVVAIGPVTAAAARELHLDVAAVADPHDLDGLLVALGRAAGR